MTPPPARKTIAPTEQPAEVSPGALDLLEFVPAISPRWEAPVHLAAIIELFARAERGEEVRALVSVPPQFGKTESLLHGCAWQLSRHPETPIIYASYAADYAHSRSRLARDYARRAGVKLRDDSKAVHEWMTTDNGGMRAVGIGGGVAGYPAKLLIVDDPHAGREEAESALDRQKVADWFTGDAMTRVHPGASVIVCHTRWHEDDLIGRLSKDKTEGWEVINLPAIKEDGTALWYRRPLDFLAKARARNEYDWWSLYMGSPRARGKEVFRGVYHYDELPTSNYRIAIGVDLAYTAKTHADYSVAVVAMFHESTLYVLDVIRAQVEAPKFAATLRQLRVRYPGARMMSFIGGTEKGVVDFLNSSSQGLRLESIPARTDKFVRAQPAAAAWNEGRLLVPRAALWLHAFVQELVSFSGVGDAHDDQVDALAGAVAAIASSSTPRSIVNMPFA